MFLYILNLLNDGLRKKNDTDEGSALEIINDTIYISQLAGIKKSLNFENINDKIVNIFEILDKYNLTTKDSIGILNKLIINNNNSWITEKLYNSNNNKKNELESFLNATINMILEKSKKGGEYMKINHLAIWANNIEKMKEYYVKFFDGEAGTIYTNESKGFYSYFITFDSGARIEIMGKKDVDFKAPQDFVKGYAHIAISVGSKEKVDILTEEIRNAGYEVISETRTTGDGYYESCVLDPEGNLVEITI